ncbi:subunit NuA4 of histone acetyltransferase [Encephalitozoon intestinalis ATCC 50506]|uniref:Chromatin modification-related protein EAF6 n=1 Tax=Encephalitozoon intestinalis (strain ATCC 50506) TaxID=876142 RepID=W8P961_ENCIT|nr:subunit NuA4 of histone acetyltransferase [Encephalitozoon intestinalis ATCC 50506]AHL30168.1 subunit NuA4 of histone acetyltransferase [Encephalitozoon intestinalis ATCC 50506]UTX46400.1 hypothetical protein GPK93_11g20070 [Encephalitozoon intestinalis]
MNIEDTSLDAKKRFKALLAKRKKLRKQIRTIEREMFRHETVYLEMTQGSPLTKNVEYYVSNRAEKKKYNVDDKMRIFNKNFPRTDR